MTITLRNDKGDTLTHTELDNNFVDLNDRLSSLEATALAGLGLVFISQESDFDVQDTTTITLETKKVYFLAGDITTSKRFIVEDGAVLTAYNSFGVVLTYTGTDPMFSGTDVSFTVREVVLDSPNAETFNFEDTVGGVKLFVANSTRVNSCTKLGTFDDLQTVQFINSATVLSDDGITVTGSNVLILSIDKLAMTSTDASFIGIDIGTSVIANIEMDNLYMNGPTGSIGISGTTASGNVPSGQIATLSNSSFVGNLTPLSGISSDDIRWLFSRNTPIPDTLEDALVSLTSNATETVISTSSTPVKATGTWVVQRASHFTADTTGKVTYKGERTLTVPVDISTTISAASGSNKDIAIYLAVNGTVISATALSNLVGSGDPRNTGITWQVSLDTDDYLELFVENNTDTVNLIVENAVLRVK